MVETKKMPFNIVKHRLNGSLGGLIYHNLIWKLDMAEVLDEFKLHYDIAKKSWNQINSRKKTRKPIDRIFKYLKQSLNESPNWEYMIAKEYADTADMIKRAFLDIYYYWRTKIDKNLTANRCWEGQIRIIEYISKDESRLKMILTNQIAAADGSGLFGGKQK